MSRRSLSSTCFDACKDIVMVRCTEWWDNVTALHGRWIWRWHDISSCSHGISGTSVACIWERKDIRISYITKITQLGAGGWYINIYIAKTFKNKIRKQGDVKIKCGWKSIKNLLVAEGGLYKSEILILPWGWLTEITKNSKSKGPEATVENEEWLAI